MCGMRVSSGSEALDVRECTVEGGSEALKRG